MCDFCEKYANISGKHRTIRLGAENYMLFANSENEPMGAIKIKICPLCGRELTADGINGIELGITKAVLVMDMPESCSKCKFLYEFQGIKKCQLMNVLNNGASMLSQNTFTKKRHDKCPLRELPERETEMTDADDLGRDYVRGTMDGWNACLDEIKSII